MNIYTYILVMALITYLIRMLPLVLIRTEITNVYVKSFLHYVPYACLTAMTVPSVFYATDYTVSAVISFVVAGVLGFKGKSLPVVSIAAVVTVLIIEGIMKLAGI